MNEDVINADVLKKLLDSYRTTEKHEPQESLKIIEESKKNYNEQIEKITMIGEKIQSTALRRDLESEKREIIADCCKKWETVSNTISLLDSAIKSHTELMLVDYNLIYVLNEKIKRKTMDGIGFSGTMDFIKVPVYLQEQIYQLIDFFSSLIELTLQTIEIHNDINAVVGSQHHNSPRQSVDYPRIERIAEKVARPMKMAFKKGYGKLSQIQCAEYIISAKKYFRTQKQKDLSGRIHAAKIAKLPNIESVMRTIQRWDQHNNSGSHNKGTCPPDGYSRFLSPDDFQDWAFRREKDKYLKWKIRLHAALNKTIRKDNDDDNMD